MNEERIKEVFSDEAFVKQLLEQEEAEDVQALLAEKEIDISVEEIKKIAELLKKYENSENDLDELSDELLEEVSGGILLSALLVIGSTIGATACFAAASGIAMFQISNKRSRW